MKVFDNYLLPVHRQFIANSLMEKVFGCIMEVKLKAQSKKNGKISYEQEASFRKHPNNNSNFFKFQVLMAKSCLQFKVSYCCFIDLKIASDYMFVVTTWIYEKVIWHILMEIEFQFFSLARLVLSKDTYHLHFDLCTNELEQIINAFVKQEGIPEFTI